MATRTSTKRAATGQQIAERAYERFLSRGGEHGHDIEDWLSAESEVMATKPARRSSPRATSGARKKD